ncbi:MAG: IS607 family transposase [Moraxella sp.]|nr:IS607 family transposase [Moraxella sp.]
MIPISSLNKDFYKPRDVVALLGVSLPTVQNMTRDGRLVAIRSETNRRLITRESLIHHLRTIGVLYEQENRSDVIYARVSTHKQKERGDLDRQITAISSFVIHQNPKNLQILSDVGSGLNDNRKSLNKLITMVQDNKIDRIFILYKDRLTRFGFNYIKAICDKHNTQIIIISDDVLDKTMNEELAEDIVSIIHSFSGKMYGLRSKIKEQIKAD